MKRRTAVRLISLLSAIALVLGIFLIKSELKTEQYRLELENSYSRNLDDFNTAINNISSTLSKARFATTPAQLSSMAAKLLAEAELSKTALAQLPQGEELTVLNRFLSQVGNYAMAVSKSLISGEELTQKDAENIDLLSATAQKISTLVSDSRITYNNYEYWAKELDQKLDTEVDSETLSASLGELEEELADFPTLIYDGPYSDHILEKEPSLLQNTETVSQSSALEIAAKTAECEEKSLKYDGISVGHITAYRFVGEEISVSVSRVGGHTVFMRKERDISSSILSYEQALEKAKRYLSRIGKNGFVPTYYSTSDGVCVVNFAFVDGETVCYTDLIKVGVAMDNGEIMLYEASGYISNHKNRTFPTPTYTPEQAKEILSNKLTLTKTSVALIPDSSGEEVRCYELSCISEDEQEILVYINVSTLAEEEILILLKSDGGTLVK